eukprot:8875575-Ditylum_brightwellii.AAC.1
MGVHNNRPLDDETIFVEACYVSVRVSKGDFIDLIGVQPNLMLSTFEDRCCKALLELEGHHHLFKLHHFY